MTERALQTLKAIVPLVLAFFVGRMILSNWDQVRGEDWAFEPIWLAASLGLGSAWHLARPLGWTWLLRGFDHRVPYWDVYLIYRKSELSRYVPGGVWQFAARVYLVRRFGVSASACLAATLLDLTLAALAALVPAAWLAVTASESLSAWQLALLLAFPVLALAIVYPPVFNTWAGRVTAILRQDLPRLEFRVVQMARIWTMYVCSWILLAGAMACFARGLLPGLAFREFVQVAASYPLAWVTALLTMIAPAGVGVREGVLGLLLARSMAVGTAMAIAVAMRLWAVSTELAWLAVGLGVARFRGQATRLGSGG